MNQVIRIFLLCILCMSPLSSFAQGPETGLTILSVKTALEDVLKRFNLTIATAGNESRSLGVSLTQNAQNLLSDMDQELGKRLNEMTDTLVGLEKTVVEDAILLTKQMREATEAIATKGGEEARRTIAEADITAYNASYSLPCRSWIPRILYTVPQEIRAGTNLRDVRIRGNFLDIGSEPIVKVGGYEAKLVTRARNEILIELPDALLSSISRAQSYRVELPLNQVQRSNFLSACSEKVLRVEPAPTAAVILRPNLSFKVSGTIGGTKGSIEYQQQPAQNFGRSDNDCDANYDVDQPYCVPKGWNFDRVVFWQIVSANCNSSVGSPQVSGSRCVKVPAHLGGCGYNANLLVVKNCRGRGFFEYNIKLRAWRGIRVAIDNWAFEQKSEAQNQRSFTFPHPASSTPQNNPRWTYVVRVEIKEGARDPYIIEASSANPNPENIITRIEDGVLSVEIRSREWW